MIVTTNTDLERNPGGILFQDDLANLDRKFAPLKSDRSKSDSNLEMQFEKVSVLFSNEI